MIHDIRSQLALSISKQKIAVDTNALYWTFYGKCSYSNETRQKLYPRALQDLKVKNNILYAPGTCIYELFSIIEKNEYELFCARTGNDQGYFKLKDYRSIKTERESVAKEINITYKNIVAFMKITDQKILKRHIAEIPENYTSHSLDVYDKALVDYCKEEGIMNIVTDDADYMSLDKGINIFTANEKYFR